MEKLFQSIQFIQQLKIANIDAKKEYIKESWVRNFSPVKSRSVFLEKDFSLRFSEANTESFSNTVLSLSALKKHDNKPFVVVVCRPKKVDFLLANSTFIKKISHSSLKLRVDNIKGSFNGSDIISKYGEIENIPSNFSLLYLQHEAFSWEENLERLVETTNGIVATGKKFTPTNNEIKEILLAPRRTIDAVNSKEYNTIEKELQGKLKDNSLEILKAAKIENVNIRGNTIENFISGGISDHGLGDITKSFKTGRLVIDVKTKLSNLASSPKAYNIDKMLIFLSNPGSVFAFFIVEINIEKETVRGRLIPVIEESLLNCTAIQHHWAGRESRGVTQLSGLFYKSLDESYMLSIVEKDSKCFLRKLIDL